MRRRSPLVLAAFAAIYLIWGSTYLAIRIAIETVPPFTMMAVRSLAAGVILYGWGRWRGGASPTRGEWAGGVLVGAALFLVGHGGLAWAQQRVSSGVASLFMATVPLWMTLADAVADPAAGTGWRESAGVASGLAGILLLVGPGDVFVGDPIDGMGAFVLLAAALSWSAGTALAKRLPRPSSLAVTTGTYLLGGGFLLLILGLSAGETTQLRMQTISAGSAASLAYLVVFGSVVAFGAYTWLLERVSLTAVSTCAFVNPVIAVFLGWRLADESIGPRVLVAAALAVAGVASILSSARVMRRTERTALHRQRAGSRKMDLFTTGARVLARISDHYPTNEAVTNDCTYLEGTNACRTG